MAMTPSVAGGSWFEAKMAIGTSGVVGGDGDSGHRRLTASMDKGGRSCLTVASVAIYTAFSGGSGGGV